jgi:hypothetical protein
MAETKTNETVTETTEKVHSKKFGMLKERWDKDYITKDTLKGWVVLNEKRAGKGITAEEYKEITGEDYEASEE